MRRWMMAGSAACMLTAGAARAVEPAKESTTAISRETAREARGPSMVTGSEARAAHDAAPVRADFVTREELQQLRDELRARLERGEQQSPVRFTDQG